jgi:formylglycine-generating enzyme
VKTARRVSFGSICVRLSGAVAATVLVSTAGCSRSMGGLEVIIATDGLSAPADFDAITLQVSQQGAGQAWNKLWNVDYGLGVASPSEASAGQVTLPATFAVIAGQSADQEVLITVTAFKGGPTGLPIVLRQAQVQAPTDRVAALWIVLAQACVGQVARADAGPDAGALGEPQSTCLGMGQSCLPTIGGCGPDAIPSSLLPTYVPGKDLDAGLESSKAGEAIESGTASEAVESGIGGAQGDGGTGSAPADRDSSNASVDSGTGGTPVDSGTGNPSVDSGMGGAPVDSGTRSADAAPTGVVIPESCLPGGSGLSNCGAGGTGVESCCASLEVPSGTYDRTYTSRADGGAMGLRDPASVSGFRLDKFLVTVGRFRQYVSYVTSASGRPPSGGGGIHAHLNGGLGLANSQSPGTYETGWDATDWGAQIPAGSGTASTWSTNLVSACTPYNTWTPSPGTHENLPINCVDWYEAYAFCIWDAGFLPSEAEWEYVAAGGSQELQYPWGSTDPGAANAYAIYGPANGACYYPTGTSSCTGVGNIAPVGTATRGGATWGQVDMAGNLFEWTVDAYGTYVDPCVDCAYLPPAPMPTSALRVVRGGCFNLPASYMQAATRGDFNPTNRFIGFGFRCARTP